MENLFTVYRNTVVSQSPCLPGPTNHILKHSCHQLQQLHQVQQIYAKKNRGQKSHATYCPFKCHLLITGVGGVLR